MLLSQNYEWHGFTGAAIGILPVEEPISDAVTRMELPELTESAGSSESNTLPIPEAAENRSVLVLVAENDPALQSDPSQQAQALRSNSIFDSLMGGNIPSGTEVIRAGRKFSNTSSILISTSTQMECKIYPDSVNSQYKDCETVFEVECFRSACPTVLIPAVNIIQQRTGLANVTINFSNTFISESAEFVNASGYFDDAGEFVDTTMVRSFTARNFINFIPLPTRINFSIPFAFKVNFKASRWTSNSFNLTLSAIGISAFIDPDVTACGTLSAEGAYSLTANITSTDTCININFNNINLNCSGFNITYGTGTTGGRFGVNNTGGFDNITIQNCIIREGGTGVGGGKNAIHMAEVVGSIENVTIFNNTINTIGQTSHAINLAGPNNANISFNTLLPSGAGSAGMTFNPLTGGKIHYNLINSTFFGDNPGILIQGGSDDNNFTQNRIITNNTGTSLTFLNPAVRIIGGSDRLYFANNTILSTIFAFYSEDSSNHTLYNNSINSSMQTAIFVTGTIRDHYNHTIGPDNLADGLPIAYNFSFFHRTMFDSGSNFTNVYGQIICAWCSNVTYSNITIMNDGISFFNVTDSLIEFMNITTYTGQGILIGRSSTIKIRNNSINLTRTTVGPDQPAIYLLTGSNSSIIENNTIFGHGSNSIGIGLASSSSNNTLRSNQIITCCGGQSNYGIRLTIGTMKNQIINNNVTTQQGGSIFSLFLITQVNDTLVMGNKFTTRSPGQAPPIRIGATSGNNIFVNNNVSTPTTGTNANFEDISDISTVSFINYLIYNSSFGEIKWDHNGSGSYLEQLNITASDVIGLDTTFFIKNNTVAVNTSSMSNNTRINASANITMRGLSFGNITGIFRVLNYSTDNTTIITTGTDCLGSTCILQSYDNTTGVAVFNVSFLGSYALQGTATTARRCENITSNTTNYLVLGPINTTETCFTIKAHNVTLDCQGFAITYGIGGVGGYGVNNSGYDNVTIKNCEFREGNNTANGKFGVFFYDGAENGTIVNNTFSMNGTSSYGIALNLSNGNIVKNNTVDSIGVSGSSIFLEGSDDVIIENNTLRTTGANARGVDITVSSDRVLVRRNEIKATNANGAYGILLNISINNSLIISNNITTANSSIFIQTSVNLTQLINNNLTSTAGNELSDDSGSSFVNYLFYNNSFGEIKWIHDNDTNSFLRDLEVDGDGITGLGVGKSIFINNNSAAFNTSAYVVATSKINSSANVTFFALDSIVTRNRILRVDNVTTSAASIIDAGKNCNGTSCFILSYANGILIFNTTGFSSFASTNNSLPGPPILTSPNDASSVTVLTPTLVWSNSVDADRDNVTYQAQVDNNADFTSPEVNTSSILESATSTNLTVGVNLVAGTTYSWRVRGFDTFDFGNFSATRTFTVASAATEAAAAADVASGSTGRGSSEGAIRTAPSVVEFVGGEEVRVAREMVSAGESILVSVEDIEIGVQSIRFTAVDTIDIKVAIARRLAESITILPLGTTVYKYFEITVENVDSREIENPILTIVVPESWLIEQQSTPENIILLRQEGDMWQEYSTAILHSQDGFYYLESEIPGFSIFAIGLKEAKLSQERLLFSIIKNRRTMGITTALLFITAVSIVAIFSIIKRRRRPFPTGEGSFGETIVVNHRTINRTRNGKKK